MFRRAANRKQLRIFLSLCLVIEGLVYAALLFLPRFDGPPFRDLDHKVEVQNRIFLMNAMAFVLLFVVVATIWTYSQRRAQLDAASDGEKEGGDSVSPRR